MTPGVTPVVRTPLPPVEPGPFLPTEPGPWTEGTWPDEGANPGHEQRLKRRELKRRKKRKAWLV